MWHHFVEATFRPGPKKWTKGCQTNRIFQEEWFGG